MGELHECLDLDPFCVRGISRDIWVCMDPLSPHTSLLQRDGTNGGGHIPQLIPFSKPLQGGMS